MSGRTDSCPRENEVIDLVAIGQWPDRADDDLRAHAERCGVCGDLAVAACAVVELRDTSEPGLLPDASVVWGRARLRAREDAVRRAAQPLHLAHGLAFSAIAGLGLAWWGLGASWMQTWWTWLSGLAPELPAGLSLAELPVPSIDVLPSLTTIAVVTVVSIVIVPVAVYFADR
jgi:hypothetical protein